MAQLTRKEDGTNLLALDGEELDFLYNLLDFVGIFASEGKPGYQHMESIRIAIAGGEYHGES